MPDKFIQRYSTYIERGISLFVLLIMLTYTYVYLFRTPYPGFSFNSGSGVIEVVFVAGKPGAQLATGDKLLQLGNVKFSTYQSDKRLRIFKGMKPGQVIPLNIERDRQTLTVNWVYPGMNPGEFQSKLFNVWWLGFIFYGFGIAVLLFVRPKNARWRLMIAFNYLTALWLTIGISSSWAIWESAVIFRVILWIAIPVYILLHWEFPVSLGKLPFRYRAILVGVGVVFAVLQWVEAIPADLVYMAFALGVLCIAGLLAAQFFRFPKERRRLFMTAGTIAFAFLPPAILSLNSYFKSNYYISVYSMAAFPVLPAIYFYTLFRRQLGGLELRANRLMSTYFFFVILGTLGLLVLTILPPSYGVGSSSVLLILGLPVVVASLVLLWFPRFERWVEVNLLSIPLPPTRLLESYAARISSSMEIENLTEVLNIEVLPSLMVRQSAIVCYDDLGKPYLFFQRGLSSDFRIENSALKAWWQMAGEYHPYREQENNGDWVRLVLPLIVGKQRIGLWLFGRRDPDDFYSQSEIPILQAMADQTAIAILNHTQSERLTLLYQDDLARKEAERLQLAQELHDGVLNQLALLSLAVDMRSPAFEEAYSRATARIREIISGLRPTMLNYGLRAALDELADEAPAQVGGDVEIQVELPNSDVRYLPNEELHLYRIIQEACKNALMHAHASIVRIGGMLEPDCFDLFVEDDGTGMPEFSRLDLDGLLARKHFGLAGMIERARVIGAQMEITSFVDQGTRIRIHRP